jgi:hypothetical protein
MNNITILIVAIVILILISTGTSVSTSTGTSTGTLDKKTTIKKLVRQASRYLFSSKQDSEPMISILHANYGWGYLMALDDLFTSDEILKASGVSISFLRSQAEKIQEDAVKRSIVKCPQYAIDDPLAIIGGN